MDLSFATSEPFSVGLEEELVLAEPQTLGLGHYAEAAAAGTRLPDGWVQLEWYTSLIELTPPPFADVPAAARALERARAALIASGAVPLGSGTHPAGRYGDVRMVPRERYSEVASEVGEMVLRTPEAALHVHVGVPNAETAVRVANGLREWIPMFQALSANSPFAFGVDSGFASARSILNRSYPRVDVPPAFRDYDDYAAQVAELAAAAGADDYTRIWWEVRPHPRLGTVELRSLDAQASLAAVAGLAALVHALARRAAEEPPARATSQAALLESAYRASRFGLDATVLHLGALRPVRVVTEDALALAAPHARELSCEASLDEVRRILREGNGADRQRRIHAEAGMDGLLAELRRATALPLRA